jgi:hypothetical protein
MIFMGVIELTLENNDTCNYEYYYTLPVKIVIPECKNGYISGQTWNITFVDR